MKRTKRIVAFVAVAALTVSSSVFAFAASDTTATATTPAASAMPSASATTTATAAPATATPTPVATMAPAKTYADLAVTAKSFYDDKNNDLGTYPVVTGMDTLSTTIYDELFKDFAYYQNDQITNWSANRFKVTYEVVNSGRYAAINVTYAYSGATDSLSNRTDVKNYFVDKDTMTVITADAFKTATADALVTATPAASATTDTAAVAAPTVTDAAAAAAEEAIMVPVRKYAEALGFTLSWKAETKSVVLQKDDFLTTIRVDKNAYTVNGFIVELEVAPSNQDGTLYVPVSFFEKVLGAKVTTDKDGNVEITMPAK